MDPNDTRKVGLDDVAVEHSALNQTVGLQIVQDSIRRQRHLQKHGHLQHQQQRGDCPEDDGPAGHARIG